MEEFLNWAFYDHAYKDKNVNVIYQCYLIYCDLFECDRLSKYKFIELYQSYLKNNNHDKLQVKHTIQALELK